MHHPKNLDPKISSQLLPVIQKSTQVYKQVSNKRTIVMLNYQFNVVMPTTVLVQKGKLQAKYDDIKFIITIIFGQNNYYYCNISKKSVVNFSIWL